MRFLNTLMSSCSQQCTVFKLYIPMICGLNCVFSSNEVATGLLHWLYQRMFLLQHNMLNTTAHAVLTCLSLFHCAPYQMYLNPLMVVCRWWRWMKQARSESLGADQHWDLVKWSLVTLCSTGEGEPRLTPLAQCLALVQPHTPSPTSILEQCMKWELHQMVHLDWVDTAVEVGSKLQRTTVSKVCKEAFLYVWHLTDRTLLLYNMWGIISH